MIIRLYKRAFTMSFSSFQASLIYTDLSVSLAKNETSGLFSKTKRHILSV